MHNRSVHKFEIDFSGNKNAELFYGEYREPIDSKINQCLLLNKDGDHSNATIRFPVIFTNDFSITEMCLEVIEVNKEVIRFKFIENYN